MGRREFIMLLGGAAAARPLTAHAQQSAMPVVGFLSSRSPKEAEIHSSAFRQGLNLAGFLEGQNVEVTYRWEERLRSLAAKLAGLRVSVMVAAGGAPSALVAQTATGGMPIVFIIGDDPVKPGLVASQVRSDDQYTNREGARP